MLIKKDVKIPLNVSEWILKESRRLGTSENMLIMQAIISYKNRHSYR